MYSNSLRCKLNKKCGFTLIELVVVIAILTILIAIGIPMTISIINAASATTGDSQAATLTRQCVDVYSGVSTGAINSTYSKNADGTSVTFAPQVGSPNSQKTIAANNITVLQVKIYSGLNIDITSDYYYCTASSPGSDYIVGNIIYSENGAPNVVGCTFNSLTDNTNLGTILL